MRSTETQTRHQTQHRTRAGIRVALAVTTAVAGACFALPTPAQAAPAPLPVGTHAGCAAVTAAQRQLARLTRTDHGHVYRAAGAYSAGAALSRLQHDWQCNG